MKKASILFRRLAYNLAGIFILLVMGLNHACHAAEFDTLRTYQNGSPFYAYNRPDIALQVARFDIVESSMLKKIVVTLGGDSAHGSVQIRVFGHEAGVSVPFLEKDLIPPVTLNKTRSGYERKEIILQQPVELRNNQFFIAISDISPGVTLLTDRIVKRPFCQDSTAGSYYYQAIKTVDDNWHYSPFSYLIDVIVEKKEEDNPVLFERDSSIVFSSDQSRYDFSIKNVACADINKDGYIDVLTNGKLFINDHGRLVNKTKEWGLPDSFPRAGIFIDANNDGHMDVLLIGDASLYGEEANTLFINDGYNRCVSVPLPHLPSFVHPTSISVADINNDNLPDVFIGQCVTPDAPVLHNYLLVNEGGNTFRDITSSIVTEMVSTSRGASFVDVNNDNQPDLFIANYYGKPNQLWINKGNLLFEDVYQQVDGAGVNSTFCSGGHWADYNRDTLIDLLLPQYVRPQEKQDHTSPTAIHSGRQELTSAHHTLRIQEVFEYEESHSGGAWGDINNDGLMDCILTTACPCRYADVYVQSEQSEFILRTASVNLEHLSNISDAIWADINNDGLLDLLVIDTTLAVYKQRSSGNRNNYVDIELQSVTSNKSAIGAKAYVYADDNIYYQQVISGRGLLMQDPLRLHFGIGHAKDVDSVVVQWPDGSRETFNNIAVNTITTLTEGQSYNKNNREPVMGGLSVYPNPSSDNVVLAFSLSNKERVIVDVLDLQGDVLLHLFSGPLDAGIHTIDWNGKDKSGISAPSGIYLLRLQCGTHESYSERVTIVR